MMSHLAIYNYLAIIIVYVMGCGLYYCFLTARVPTRGGWVNRTDAPKLYWAMFGLFSACAGLFVAGVTLVNWIKYTRG